MTRLDLRRSNLFFNRVRMERLEPREVPAVITVTSLEDFVPTPQPDCQVCILL